MHTTEAKCKINHYPNEIKIDSVGTLTDIHHMVGRFGGTISVYELQFGDDVAYRMGYRLFKCPFDLIIYGIELTKEQYDLQIASWSGNNSNDYEARSLVTLVDNLYFI